MKRILVKIFNLLVKGKKSDSTFLHYHESAYGLLRAKLASLRSGLLLYAYDRAILGQHLKTLRKIKGSKSNIDALIVANGPSCNKLNFEAIREAQLAGLVEVFGVNNSILIGNKHKVHLDYLLLSDPLNKPDQNLAGSPQLHERIGEATKLLTPLNWHKSYSLKDCVNEECLHFIDSGRNQFSLSTDPTKLRTYPPMGSFKLLAIAKYFGYRNIFIIGLDNTFFKTVRLGPNKEILQDPFYYSADYALTSNDSHLFPDGISDYFHFVGQNFLTLKKYFNNPCFINLNQDSLIDAFDKVEDNCFASTWLLPTA
jgi:hypothetical protein